MNRREFLRSRRLAQAAGQVIAALGEVVPPPEPLPPQDVALLRASRRAMATTFEVLLPAGFSNAVAAAEDALDEIDRLEAQLTVYRDDSEVSRLNQFAFANPVRVEEGLFQLLELAARLSVETEGAFDIAAGALIKAWGFFRGPRRVPSEHERSDVLGHVGLRHVLLNPEERSVRYLRSGLEINLGAIGKGYALDRVADLLRRQWNLSSGLLHGGHSSVYAIGNAPGENRGWAVGLTHPWDPEQRLAVVRLSNRALGTSAATFQHLEYNGRKLGHILDPRTGWPADGMASASVLAPTAAEADALATAFFLLGVDRARAYCEAHPGVGAVLLLEGTSDPVILGLAPHEIDWLPPGSRTGGTS
jgi:thiamine biosynthesis lipoprotein